MIEFLVLAIAPGLFFAWFFYIRDKYGREPKSMILGLVFPDGGGLIQALLHYLIAVSLVEESVKLLAVWRAYRSPEFDEVMDGIVYCATAALGFAGVENVFYVLSVGVETGIFGSFCLFPGMGPMAA